jgi:predicted MFS family arabinose efflux permease
MASVKNEKLLLVILAAIQFTNIVDFMIMMPMGDILKKQLDISPQQYGILVSSYGIAAFITAFAGVFYLDNLDRKKALLYAYFGFIVSTMSSAILPNTDNVQLNYYLFILTRVMTGLTGGLLGGLVMSIIGDVIPLERRGKAIGMVTMAFSLAAILGMPVTLTLVDLFDNNWHVPFYLVSGLALPFWYLAYKKIPPLGDHLKIRTKSYDRTETIRLALNTREQRNALFFTFLLVLGQFTVISFMTPYYINNVGLAQSDIKWIYLVGGTATVLTSFSIGRMVDKIGRFRVFTIFAWLSLVPVFAVTNLPTVPLYVVLIIASLFFIFISGRMIPANTIATSVVLPQHRAGFMSLNSAMMSLSSGTSGLISGAIIFQETASSPLQNYPLVGIVAASSTLTALLIVRLLKRFDAEKRSESVG